MMFGVNNSNVRKISIKDTDGKVTGTISITKPTKKKQRKVQYNFKELSGQLMRAKTMGNTSQVAAKARGKIAQLRKNLRSGEYDDKKIENAINHAEKMIRIAQKRMKHLREEDNEKKQHRVSQTRKEKTKTVSKESIRREALKKVDKSSDSLTRMSAKNMDPYELERLKKKHRSEEMREIREADLKYIKAMHERQENDEQAISSGVSCEISGVEMPVTAEEPPVSVEGGNFDLTI